MPDQVALTPTSDTPETLHLEAYRDTAVGPET